VLQGYAVVMLLLLAALYRSRYTRGADIYWVFGAYLAAKLFEPCPLSSIEHTRCESRCEILWSTLFLMTSL
jgi:hypothetical protein